MTPLALLANVVPTIIALVLLRRRFTTHSLSCLCVVAWLISQVFVTALTYALGCVLVSELSPTLRTANVVTVMMVMGVLGAMALRNRKTILSGCRSLLAGCTIGKATITCLYLTLSTLFSYYLFNPHFYEQGGYLYRSHVYWDITAHYPIVQNFAFGDNFPAQDETAAGLPLLYHFFSDLQIASNVSLGASLPGAFLWVSVLSLVSLLVLVREFSRELFKSEVAGFISGVLVLTSSNLRWLFDFQNPWSPQGILAPLSMDPHPFTYSTTIYPFDRFNLSMFNLFYFVEERHVIFASALVVMVALLLRNRISLTLPAALAAGILLGLFCNWNFFILPMLCLLLLPGLVIPGQRRSHLIMLCVLGIVAGSQLLAAREVIANSTWFTNDTSTPRINFGFATAADSIPLTWSRFFTYYLFSAGPTFVCAGIGISLLWRRSRRDLFLLLPVIVGTFALINSVQVMSSVYENHKWLKPLQGFLNILAVAPFALLLQKKSASRIIATIGLFALLTVSGLAEAITFLKTTHDTQVAPYPSEFMGLIQKHTKPHDIFATLYPREILLAGRSIYYLNRANLAGTQPHLWGLKFKFSAREQEQRRIYSTPTVMDFCRVTEELGVQVVEFSPQQQELPLFPELRDKVLFWATPVTQEDPFAYVHAYTFCKDTKH